MRKQREGWVTEPATATQVGKDSCHGQDMDPHTHLNQQPATPWSSAACTCRRVHPHGGLGQGGTHATSKPWRTGPSAASSPPHLRFRSLSHHPHFISLLLSSQSPSSGSTSLERASAASHDVLAYSGQDLRRGSASAEQGPETTNRGNSEEQWGHTS